MEVSQSVLEFGYLILGIWHAWGGNKMYSKAPLYKVSIIIKTLVPKFSYGRNLFPVCIQLGKKNGFKSSLAAWQGI